VSGVLLCALELVNAQMRLRFPSVKNGALGVSFGCSLLQQKSRELGAHGFDRLRDQSLLK
jgi:hypothetical protein